MVRQLDADVGYAVGTVVDGTLAGDYREEGREIDLVIVGEEEYRKRLEHRARKMGVFWRKLSVVATPGGSTVVLVVSAALLIVGLVKGTDVEIGDLHQGVPELRPDSRYNKDTKAITEKFSIGVDVMTVFAETGPEGCIDYATMASIDEFSWHMTNIPGVQSVLALPAVAAAQETAKVRVLHGVGE